MILQEKKISYQVHSYNNRESSNFARLRKQCKDGTDPKSGYVGQ